MLAGYAGHRGPSLDVMVDGAQDLVDAVRTDADPAVTGEEATKSLRILLAVYESSRTGRPIRF